MGRSQKGSQFERDFAVALSKWWSDGESEDWFWRVGGSGGRATNRGKRGASTVNGYGDISAQHPEAQKLLDVITFELKRGYNDSSVQDMWDKPTGVSLFEKFMDQAQAAASLAGTPYYALVWKRDRRHSLVFTNFNELNDTPWASFEYRSERIAVMYDVEFFTSGQRHCFQNASHEIKNKIAHVAGDQSSLRDQAGDGA